MYFYKKRAEVSNEPARLINSRELMPGTLPRVFMDIRVRVFCKDPRHRAEAQAALATWSEDGGGPEPMMSQSQLFE